MSDRLFNLDEYPEVPLFREPRRLRGAAISDERLAHDYPPEWSRCPDCGGSGKTRLPGDDYDASGICPPCGGMGSAKARVRREAGHRCVRCGHPYIPKGDAKILGVDPTPFRWSRCDENCHHGGSIRLPESSDADGRSGFVTAIDVSESVRAGLVVEAEWRILTVHHLDGDKANLSWWNLAALCQTCHLHIQNKVVIERVYPHPHSEWFKPHVAGYYAEVYLGETLTREETVARMDELLALELDPAYG